ncbi:MAG: molybdopterin adenylyltransferase [Chloroflexota bacterium]|nr:molybdopterin adenylyltransferase [Chloroflexota bacterium]
MMRIGVLTVSDRSSRGETEDRSGPLIAELIKDRLGSDVRGSIVPDEQDQIERLLRAWSDDLELDLVLTTGGTGFSPRDVTPEATSAVVHRLAPGFTEAMRAASLQITPHAMLSRSVAGIRGKTLIINLPGSPKAVQENLEVILPAIPHAVELLQQGEGPVKYQHAGQNEHLH